MRHPYHLVDVSPWPISMAFGVFTAAIAMVSWLGNYTISNILVLSIILLILFIPYVWWRDVSREAKAGYHTLTVQRGIQIGFLLFLLSEIMLFVSFFWGYLHSCLAPVIELGSVWPPVGVYAIQPFGLPLVGTCIL